MDKCEVIIYWNAEDGGNVSEMPELAGCMAHGKTQREALANLREAAALWIKAAEVNI